MVVGGLKPAVVVAKPEELLFLLVGLGQVLPVSLAADAVGVSRSALYQRLGNSLTPVVILGSTFVRVDELYKLYRDKIKETG